MTDPMQKQYVLSSRRLVFEQMKEIELGNKYLYVHPKLSVLKTQTADRKKAFLLGHAFCTDKVGKKPADDIVSANEKDVSLASRHWTGRWALITENQLILDAAGLMSAFYTCDDAAFYVSSSLAILAALTQQEAKKHLPTTGLSWQILPHTLFPKTKALLCTQKIAFSDGQIKVLPHMVLTDYRTKTTKEKAQAVADMLSCAFQNMHAQTDKKICLALTGGKDSRLTFSALVKSGVPFSAYTAEHSNISHADQSVPKQLCNMFHVPYCYIRKKSFNREKRADYDRFCANNANGVDACFYACGQFAQLPKDAIVIRSGLFEAGQTYARSYTSPDMEGFVRGMVEYYSELKSNKAQKEAFDQWVQNAKENPIDHIDIRDRFYLEQRVGGWAAAIEQSLDICDFTSIQVANCAELLSVLLSASEAERRALSLSYDSIRLLEPNALKISINRRTIGDKVKRLRGLFRSPFAKIKRYINKTRR